LRTLDLVERLEAVEPVLHEPEPGPPALLRLDVVAVGVLRLRYAAGGAPLPDGPSDMLVEPAAPAPSASLHERVLEGGGLRAEVAEDPLSVRVRDAGGRLRFATRPVDVPELEEGQLPQWRWLFLNRYATPLGTDGTDAHLCRDLGHDERLFGLGEGFGPLDRRFAHHDLWVRETFFNATPAAYKHVPFVWSTAGWGLFVHTTNRVRLDLGASEHATAALRVEGTRALDLFVVLGDEPAELLERYCSLTGLPRVPPAWSFGLWMGRISYDRQDQVERVAAELREHEVPCDVIHVDTDWFAERWVCDWTFAPDRFPDPEGMLARLREQGFRVSLWQWPYALRQASVRAGAEEAGALLEAPDGGPVTLPGEWGDAGVVDLTRPEGVAWYRERLRPLLEAGVAAIKADFGEGAPGPELHNRFPLLYNRIWLPEGTWVDFWSGERVEGGRWLHVHAPLDHVPLWVRGGSVLPLGPVVQHVGERPLDPLEVQLHAVDRGPAGYRLRDGDGSTIAIDVQDGEVTVEGAPGRVEVVWRG